MLASGNLTQALAVTGASREEHVRLLRLVAASDGARPEDISGALALSPDMGIDSDTFFPTLALLTRKGGDTGPYMQRAEKLFGADATPMLNAFALLRNHASEAEIEKALREVPVESQARIYVAAAILRGTECPPQWRLAAQRLLFATERPYLR
jgi:hypothetical protein